jgi:hypothetical protein
MTPPSNLREYCHPDAVRRACADVVVRARDVRVDASAVAAWAERFDPASIPAGHPEVLSPAATDPESRARFALLCDALNFSFFADTPEDAWVVTWKGTEWRRYEAFAASWGRAIEADPSWLDPARWASCTFDELEAVFAGQGRLAMLPERLAVLRGVGDAMLRHFDGRVGALVERADARATEIVFLLCQAVGSFVDAAFHDGQRVPILKRAQLFVVDLAEAWKPCQRQIAGLETLTAFADYRLPEALRGLGILKLSDSLAERVDGEQWMAPGESAEVELRAGTVTSVEQMVAAARARGCDVPAWRLDWWLWKYARQNEADLPPHHRVRSIYY